MECIEAIQSRRAVRRYSDRPVDPKTIQQLIECAVLAPSAANLEPWTFSVFLDPGAIETLAQDAKAWIAGQSVKEPFTSPFHDVFRHPEYSVFYHAPALVLISAISDSPQAAEDCCLAAENLLLAARSVGLGSCWVGVTRAWFNLESTKDRLAIPREHAVVAPLVLGYPAEWPEAPPRRHTKIQWCAVPRPQEYGE